MTKKFKIPIYLAGAFVCFLACLSVSADSLDNAMYRAERLAKNGHYEEALQGYVTVYRDSHKVSCWSCVRNSFLLNPFVELAHDYPPALIALHDFRDEAEKRIIAGHPGPDDVLDWSALTEKLGEYSHALTVYKQLKSQQSPLSKDLVGFLFVTLVRDGDYVATHDVAIADAEYEKGRLRELRGYRGSAAGLQRILTSRYVLYQALLGSNEVEKANALASQLWAVSPSIETKDSLIRAAHLAGSDPAITNLNRLGAKSD